MSEYPNRRATCPRRYTQRDLELGANDVIQALDGHISREEALKVAQAVLEGYGHIRQVRGERKRAEKIHRFEGGLPRVGLRDDRKKRFPWEE